MRNKLTFFFSLFVFLILFGFTATQIQAQTVNVTMRVNTATCLDTLQPGHIVQLRGSSAKGTTPAITWDNLSGVVLTSLGGDYWEGTFQAQIGDTIQYKFWTGFNLSPETGTFH